jgi:hypothetical protein
MHIDGVVDEPDSANGNQTFVYEKMRMMLLVPIMLLFMLLSVLLV